MATLLQQGHPSFEVVSAQSGPRQLCHTLPSKHSQAVAPSLRDSAIPSGGIRDTHTQLHTSTVAAAIDRMDAKLNCVINRRKPAIHKSEIDLLCQLRSGFWRCLNLFRTVANPQILNVCPTCNQQDHSVNHILECASYPTTLLQVDLWTNHTHAAQLLSYLPPFSHLPAVPSPLSTLIPFPSSTVPFLLNNISFSPFSSLVSCSFSYYHASSSSLPLPFPRPLPPPETPFP